MRIHIHSRIKKKKKSVCGFRRRSLHAQRIINLCYILYMYMYIHTCTKKYIYIPAFSARSFLTCAYKFTFIHMYECFTCIHIYKGNTYTYIQILRIYACYTITPTAKMQVSSHIFLYKCVIYMCTNATNTYTYCKNKCQFTYIYIYKRYTYIYTYIHLYKRYTYMYIQMHVGWYLYINSSHIYVYSNAR